MAATFKIKENFNNDNTYITNNVATLEQFNKLCDEVQALTRELNNPRVYKGGWRNRNRRRK